MVSSIHYYNKLERNNIPITIIKKIKTSFISGRYRNKILDTKNIINIQLLDQDVSDKRESTNKYSFIVRSTKNVYTLDIEVYKENDEYISNYRSHRYLSGNEVWLNFFYAKYVVNTFLGMSFLSRKTVGVIALITGIITFILGFISTVWIFYVLDIDILPFWFPSIRSM
jgi:hypothetical protein